MSDKDDDLFESVNGMADRLGLEGRERQRYIHGSMTRGGYKAVPQYVRADEDEDDEDDDDFFGKGRRRKPARKKRRDDDEDDW